MPLTAKYVVKVLTGELRIGLREGLLEAAIAAGVRAAAGRGPAWRGCLPGTSGETAVLASEDRLDAARLRLLHPIKFMLASPAENAAEILSRLGPTVWVEDKYDGIRAQLHRRGSDARLYSRDLHDISDQFPEIVEAARDLAWDGILDGEILAYADGHVLPFLTLQARLGRKEPDGRSSRRRCRSPTSPSTCWRSGRAPAGARLPPATSHSPAATRAAATDGARRGDAPARRCRWPSGAADSRRWICRRSARAGRFALSHLVTADSVEALDRVFAEARARRNEGLMVKDPQSGYSPGRRGLGWLKMKRALATLDCVVVGVEAGHGKRHGVLSDYTFAVRDEATDRLVTIGKAYTGLTDAEIAEMTRWFEAHTVRQLRPLPAGRADWSWSRSPSTSSSDPTATSRASRCVFRASSGSGPTRAPAEIDTLANVERLHRELQHGAEYLVTAEARGPRKRPV